VDTLPAAFEERMVEILGSRERLDELLDADSRRALRVNRLKTTDEEVLDRLHALGLETEPVDWAEASYRVRDPEDRPLGSLWEHRSGRFFLQDPASTLPVQALDPEPGDRVLDLCAAPGSKTTHVAERLDHEGLIVANDKAPGRVNNLISNLDQTGALTAVATQFDACRLAWPLSFDKVLVDAPCSNLGGMHADWEPIKSYDPESIRRLAGAQRALLASAFHATREGGRIVYSTCTIEPRENEAVVDWFLDTYPVEIEPLDLDVGEPATTDVGEETYEGDVQAARRLWAGEQGTESFFVAAFTKQAEAPFEDARQPQRGGLDIRLDEGPIEEIQAAYGLADTVLDEARATATASKVYATTAPGIETLLELGTDRVGTYLGRPETRGYRLSFAAATLVGEAADRRIELSPDQARRWLAGEKIDIGTGHGPEWSIVTCQGEALGCARPFGTELPCYVPKRFRSPEPEANVLGFLPM
jgi:16S rRNA (cytosine1407-C5)-methyltransferase